MNLTIRLGIALATLSLLAATAFTQNARPDPRAKQAQDREARQKERDRRRAQSPEERRAEADKAAEAARKRAEQAAPAGKAAEAKGADDHYELPWTLKELKEAAKPGKFHYRTVETQAEMDFDGPGERFTTTDWTFEIVKITKLIDEGADNEEEADLGMAEIQVRITKPPFPGEDPETDEDEWDWFDLLARETLFEISYPLKESEPETRRQRIRVAGRSMQCTLVTVKSEIGVTEVTERGRRDYKVPVVERFWFVNDMPGVLARYDRTEGKEVVKTIELTKIE